MTRPALTVENNEGTLAPDLRKQHHRLAKGARISVNSHTLCWALLPMCLLLMLTVASCTAASSASSAVEAIRKSMAEDTDLNEKEAGVGTDFSRALADDKPVLLFFTPVEMCTIRYCLQPELLASRLVRRCGNRMNMVVVPVHAVNTPEKPRLADVDLGVSQVEPFATWMPELVHTQFGWGTDAPAVAVIDAGGGVDTRVDEFFDVEELAICR